MTTPDMRPALWTNVMAELDEAPGEAPRRWLGPVAAGTTIAMVAFVWFLMPSPREAERAPIVAQEQPAPLIGSAVLEPAPEPARVEVTRPGPVSLPMAREVAPAAAATAWAEVPVADIPTLPPLAGPPPIEIEPITWSEVAIAPLNVELIGLQALEIEPLPSIDHNGV